MIGNIIKNMRIDARLSQKEIADKLNMADTTISSYERENSQPDFKTILKIANLCNYDICFIDKNKDIISVKEMSKEDLFIKTKNN